MAKKAFPGLNKAKNLPLTKTTRFPGNWENRGQEFLKTQGHEGSKIKTLSFSLP